MERDPLTHMSLDVAWREIIYTANCQGCRQRLRIDLKALAIRLGDRFPATRRPPAAALLTMRQSGDHHRYGVEERSEQLRHAAALSI